MKGYRSYYNCVCDDGHDEGLYLYSDKRWTFIDYSCCVECTDSQTVGDQVDGVYIPDSLSPTPEKEDTVKKVLRFGNDDYLSQSSEEESPVHLLDKSFTGSPEWDSYGTFLERPLLLDEPLGHVTHLDRRTNLSMVLPVTSTPSSKREREREISKL